MPWKPIGWIIQRYWRKFHGESYHGRIMMGLIRTTSRSWHHRSPICHANMVLVRTCPMWNILRISLCNYISPLQCPAAWPVGMVFWLLCPTILFTKESAWSIYGHCCYWCQGCYKTFFVIYILVDSTTWKRNPDLTAPLLSLGSMYSIPHQYV